MRNSQFPLNVCTLNHHQVAEVAFWLAQDLVGHQLHQPIVQQTPLALDHDLLLGIRWTSGRLLLRPLRPVFHRGSGGRVVRGFSGRLAARVIVIHRTRIGRRGIVISQWQR